MADGHDPNDAWPAFHQIESWSPFVRRDGAGEVTLDSRAAPGPERPAGPIWSPPLPPHTLENVGARRSGCCRWRSRREAEAIDTRCRPPDARAQAPTTKTGAHPGAAARV